MNVVGKFAVNIFRAHILFCPCYPDVRGSRFLNNID